MTTPDPTVRVRDLGITFGRTRALDEVTFDLVPGVTGLLGPNGAGKTTLLRVLATVSAPDAGSVQALGLDPRRTDQRLDIFSYAVTCYEMCARKLPWEAAETLEAVLQHINTPPAAQFGFGTPRDVFNPFQTQIGVRLKF